MRIDLSSKNAVITGSGSGIGRAVALGIASCGGNVVINYRSDREGAEKTAEEIEQLGCRAEVIQADVSRAEDVRRLRDGAVKAFRDIDILINNAGSPIRRAAFLDIDEGLWEESMKVNLKSAYLCCQAFIPEMVKRRYGRIVNISSVAARLGAAGETVHYAVAKAGLNTLTVGLAKEFAPAGIVVNAVAPGAIKSAFQEKYSTAERVEKVISRTMVQRLGLVEEVASMILYLVSDYGGFIAGEVIEISGGRL